MSGAPRRQGGADPDATPDTSGDDANGGASAALVTWLRDAFDDAGLAVEGYRKLSGGAIQQNLALDLVRGDGRREPLVLRTDASSGVSVSRSRAEEHALLAAAFDARVTVPEPRGLCTDESVIGRPFFLMRRVTGTAHPVRLTRGDALGGTDRDALVDALGAELARIHAVPIDDPRLAFLKDEANAAPDPDAAPDDVPPLDPLARAVARYRRLLDELGARRPVLEWTLAWLSHQRLSAHGPTLCHNDFRTGNLMIDIADASGDGASAARVAGVLDWEFAAIGDPHEDIGWFCAPCWRFASPQREAGGLGSREAFYAGYERASGRTIDREAVPIWEIVATLRWAVIALQQGARFTSGAEPTLELGLTGRMIAELEWDLLALVCKVAGAESGGNVERGEPGRSTGDEPSGQALLEIARTVLLRELLPLLPDERRYDGLMVANAMGIAGRELEAGRGGVTRSDLSKMVPPGEAGVGALVNPELLSRLRREVSARLAIANPKRGGGERRG